MVAPSQVVRYLGLDLDSVKMEVRLPQDKVYKARTLVQRFRGLLVFTKKELMELCGCLAHASQVVKGGRTFSRRLINLLKFIPKGRKGVTYQIGFITT